MNEYQSGFEELEFATKAFQEMNVPEEPSSEFNEQLCVRLARAEQELASVSTSPQKGVFSMRRFSSIAAAVFACIGVGAIMLLSSRSNENSAYAGMIEQLKDINSMQFLVRLSMSGKQTSHVKMFVLNEKQVREEVFNPLAKNQPAIEPQFVLIHDENQRKALTLIPAKKTAKLLNKGKATATSSGIDILKKFQSMREEDAKFLGKEKVKEGMALKYSYKKPDGHYTVWLDSKSELPLKVIITGVESGHDSSLKFEMVDFVWNPNLDRNLFSLEVPEGYRLEEETNLDDMDVKGRSALVKIIRFYVRNNDDQFPESFNLFVYTSLFNKMNKRLALPGSKQKQRMQMFAKGLERPDLSEASLEEFQKVTTAFSKDSAQGAAYLHMLLETNHWYFNGKGIQLGEVEKIVAWWYPKEVSKDQETVTAHVLYGDLRIETMPVKDLPEKK